MSVPALAASPDADKLTAKQKAFCEALVENGGNVKEAALSAGYTKVSPSQSGYAALRVPHVTQYFQSLVATKMIASAAGASNAIIDLSTNAKSEYVKLEAAKDLLDRLGMRAPDKVDHRVTGELSVSIDLS